jgi:hypothetical protein
MNNQKSIKYFVISVLFYNFMWLARFPLILNGILFIIPLMQIVLNREHRLFKRCLILAVSIICFFIFMLGMYNYFRFNNVFETGIRYQQGGARYEPITKTGKLLSLENIPHNINVYFLNHVSLFVQEKEPYSLSIKPDIEGNSIFSVYPLLLLIFCIFQRKFFSNKKLAVFISISFVVICLNMLFLLLYMATGYTQFGMRYFFDMIPLLYLLILCVLDHLPKVFIFAIVIYGIVINIMGTLVVYNLLYH